MLYYDFYFDGGREARFCGLSLEEALKHFRNHFSYEPERIEPVLFLDNGDESD